MKGSRSNTFRKAIHHLKSNQIDEKIQLLSEIPTNNTSGIYVTEPEYYVQDPDVPGSEPVDFTQDDPALNGRDTTGLFGEDGSILTIEPPGDTSYVLGPMMSMWYAWGNFSTIGYVRQSDRRMVDLGRITGQIGSWDGSSNFTSYGQLTLEQANWFKDQSKIQYRAFYPGPPSNPADEFGRYFGDMISEGKPTSTTPPPRRVPPELDGFDPNIPPGEANPNKEKSEEDIRKELEMYAQALQRAYDSQVQTQQAAAALLIPAGWSAYQVLAALIAAYGLSEATKMVIQGGLEDSYRNAIQSLSNDEWEKNAERGRQRDAKAASEASERLRKSREEVEKAEASGDSERIARAKEQEANAEKNMERVQKQNTQNRQQRSKSRRERGIGNSSNSPSPGQAQGAGDTKSWQKNSYEPKGKVLSESKKSILKNIKKPYVLPEESKVKYKIKPKLNRTVNSDLMKKAEVPTSFKKAEDRMWGKYEKNKNSRLSQERKNEVLDHLGGSDHAWEYMTETSRKKNDNIMYDNFGGKKIIRKEELKGDTLLFIADENGKKESILQSELSIRLADQFNKELFEKYFSEQETVNVDKDPLFKKVSKRLKKEINYSDKPSKKGYPNDPPPEMVNGWHPEYGKDKGYYNKLDPQSADAMPETGSTEIDKKVKAARKNPK